MEAVMRQSDDKAGQENPGAFRWCDSCNLRKPHKGFHRGECADCVGEHVDEQPEEIKTEAIKFALSRLHRRDQDHLRSLLNFGGALPPAG